MTNKWEVSDLSKQALIDRLKSVAVYELRELGGVSRRKCIIVSLESRDAIIKFLSELEII